MAKALSFLKSQIPTRHLFAFYLAIPLGLAYLFALNQVGMARYLGLGASLVYWAGILVPFWLLLELCSRASALLLRPWKVPWWSILLAGSIIAVFIVSPYVRWHLSIYAGALPADVPYRHPPLVWEVLGDWKRLLSYSGVPLVWISVNYYYDRVIDIPRYRGSNLEITSASDDLEQATQPELPPLLRKIPERLGQNLLALQAEDHYVRVFTDKGSGLVRYKLKDAVSELAGFDGAQVHRSFWVSRSAIRHVKQEKHKITLVLDSGIQIPVSQAFREAARMQGILEPQP